MPPLRSVPFADRPMAFLSDIHGNARALEAVLASVAERKIRDVFAAGDLLLGGTEPLEVWRALQRVSARCIRGVSDTALARIDPASLRPATPTERDRAERFAQTREAVGELVLEQIRRLPEQIRIPVVSGGEIVVVHGSPRDPSTEISHDATDEEVMALAGDDPADLVICGAAHVPFERHVGEIHVLGLGSVGQAPEGDVAHFAVVTPKLGSLQIEHAWVRLGDDLRN